MLPLSLAACCVPEGRSSLSRACVPGPFLVRAACLVAVIAALGAHPAYAVDRYWDRGNSTNLWGDANNWRTLAANDNVLPMPGDRVILDRTFAATGVANGALRIIRQNLDPMPAISALIIDTRAVGANAAGNFEFEIRRALLTTDLILMPDPGRTITFDNVTTGIAFRVDGRIEIGIGYPGAGGTVDIATTTNNNIDWDFDEAPDPDATMAIGGGVSVTWRQTSPFVTDQPILSWIAVTEGAKLDITEDTNDTNYDVITLTSEDPAKPGRALLVEGGSTVSLVALRSRIDVLPTAGLAECSFGDADALAEDAIVSGAGEFRVRRACTFLRVGTLDRAVFSVATFWLELPAPGDLLTFADGLDATFTGAVFHQLIGSMRFGTTAANDGVVSIAGTSSGATGQWIPAGFGGVGLTHTVTVNGMGSLSYGAEVDVYGEFAGSGGAGKIIGNDLAVITLGDAPADIMECFGTDSAGALPGKIELNGSSTLTVAGALILKSDLIAGGLLTVNGSSIASVTGSLDVDLAVIASHDGGRVAINDTGRVSVSGSLTIDGNGSAGTVGGSVTVSSTRASPGALTVTGTTTMTAGAVSRAGLTITTDAFVTFTGGVSILDNAGAAQDAVFDITDLTAPGPTINFGADVTIDGTFNTTPLTFSTVVMTGGGAQSFLGTATPLTLSSFRIAAPAARTISFTRDTTVTNGTFDLETGNIASFITAGRTLAINAGARVRTRGGEFTTSVAASRFTFTIAGVADLDTATIRRTAAPGGTTLTATAVLTRLRNVAFADHAAVAGARFLTLNLPSGVPSDRFVCPGCTFEAVPVGAFNVLASDGSGDPTPTYYLFEAGPANGAGAGEGLDSDNDANSDNMLNGADPPGGAGAQWSFGSKPLANDAFVGAAEMFPQAAFDLNTGAFYAIYAAFHDVDGAGTKDVIFSRTTTGADRGISFEIAQAPYGNIVGIPWWDTEGVTHVLYAVSSDGPLPGGEWIHKWRDDGVAGVRLAGAPPGGHEVDGYPVMVVDAGAGPPPIDEITSPLIADRDRLYFGCTRAGVNKIYAVAKVLLVPVPPGVPNAPAWPPLGLAGGSAIRTAFAWTIDSGTTWLFGGSDLVVPPGTSAPLGRIDGATGLGLVANPTPAADVRAPISLAYDVFTGLTKLFVGDAAGRVHGVNALDFAAPDFQNLAGWPSLALVPASPIGASVYYDPGYNVYYGDDAGRLMVLAEGGGAYTTVVPLTYPMLAGSLDGTGVGKEIRAAPIYLNAVIWLGNNDGKVMIVDRSHQIMFKRYDLGATTVRDIAYNFDNNKFMVSTGDGYLHLFNPEPDPTPASR